MTTGSGKGLWPGAESQWIPMSEGTRNLFNDSGLGQSPPHAILVYHHVFQVRAYPGTYRTNSSHQIMYGGYVLLGSREGHCWCCWVSDRAKTGWGSAPQCLQQFALF